MLKVAGAALRPGEAVGWSFSPARARIGTDGVYQAVVEDVTIMGMERYVTVRLGNARVRLLAGHSAAPSEGLCRFDIEPDAIQVWPSSDG